MSGFGEALENVLAVEKGFANHPLDRGGPTNLGVTLRTLSRYLGRPATVDEIRALTPESVAPIYHQFYWDKIQGDALPNQIAEVLFNQAVLRGPAPVIMSLQKVLKVRPDGVMGPETIAAVHRSNARQLIFDFLREMHDSYLRIVQADPSQLAFIRGWSGRVFDLLAKHCT